MLALISIIDSCLAARERLCDLAKLELNEAAGTFWATNISETERANKLLSHTQSLAAAILDNPTPLSQSNIELLVREREHFRLSKGKNALAARSMARKRNRDRDATHNTDCGI